MFVLHSLTEKDVGVCPTFISRVGEDVGVCPTFINYDPLGISYDPVCVPPPFLN